MLYSVHFFSGIFPTSPASLGISVALKCNFWESSVICIHLLQCGDYFIW